MYRVVVVSCTEKKIDELQYEGRGGIMVVSYRHGGSGEMLRLVFGFHILRLPQQHPPMRRKRVQAAAVAVSIMVLNFIQHREILLNQT